MVGTLFTSRLIILRASLTLSLAPSIRWLVPHQPTATTSHQSKQCVPMTPKYMDSVMRQKALEDSVAWMLRQALHCQGRRKGSGIPHKVGDSEVLDRVTNSTDDYSGWASLGQSVQRGKVCQPLPAPGTLPDTLRHTLQMHPRVWRSSSAPQRGTSVQVIQLHSPAR